MIRVLIADDHPLVREGLEALILRQTDMCALPPVASGRAALEAFRKQRPDVALIDIRMPEGDGLETTRAITAEYPRARVLILTTYDGDEYIHRALEAGAVGYLIKDIDREGLLRAIRKAHAGQRCVPDRVARSLVQWGPRCDLTKREAEVLVLMARGLSNKEIGAELGITEGTVKGYVNTILSKLHVTDRTSAVTRALVRGLIRLSPD